MILPPPNESKWRPRTTDEKCDPLKKGVSEPALRRAFEYWRNIDKEIADRIAKGVKGG